MNKIKIFKLLFLGNLLLSVPFIGVLLYFFFYDSSVSINFMILFTIVGYFYWSFVVPHYKYYSVSKLENKDEYLLWEKLSINTLLFWPENFFLTQTEFWNDEKLGEYNRQKERVFSA